MVLFSEKKRLIGFCTVFTFSSQSKFICYNCCAWSFLVYLNIYDSTVHTQHQTLKTTEF